MKKNVVIGIEDDKTIFLVKNNGKLDLPKIEVEYNNSSYFGDIIKYIYDTYGITITTMNIINKKPVNTYSSSNIIICKVSKYYLDRYVENSNKYIFYDKNKLYNNILISSISDILSIYLLMSYFK